MSLCSYASCWLAIQPGASSKGVAWPALAQAPSTQTYVAAAICLFLAGGALSATFIQLLRHRKHQRDPGQALLRLLHDLPLGAVLRLGKKILMNERAAQIVGCPAGRLRTLDQWFTYLYGSQAAEMRAAYDKDRALGVEDHRTLRVKGADGAARNVQMTVHNVGKVELWLLNDVTARDESADVRRIAQQRMQQCLSQMAAMAFVLNGEGAVLLWEGRAMALLGLTSGDASGKNALSLYRDDLAFVETLRRAISGEEFTTVIDIRGHAFEVRYTALRGKNGPNGGTIGVAIDVSDRRRAERALVESERRYRLLYNTLGEIMAVHQMVRDAAGQPQDYRILDCNEALCRLLGVPRAEIVGRLATQVYGTSEAPFLETYARVARTGKREHFQQYFAPLQRYFDIDVFLPGTGDDQFATLASDVTEAKLAAEVLARQRQMALASNRAKDRFLARLSRDLRLPLTPVLALLSSLEHDDRLAEPLQGDMRIMRKNIDDQVRLLDNLVDTVQVMQGKLTLQKVPVDLHSQIRQVCQVMAGDFGAKQLRLTLELGAPEFRVGGSADRLQQVFWHLLRNALQYTPSGGEITVRSRVEKERVIVEVADTGEGMEAAFVLHVFDPFALAPQHAADEQGGVGLSLATVKALVELHGGTIEAVSDGPGKGSLFRVCLPLLAAAAGAPPSPASPGQIDQPLRILLVEDDGSTVEVLARLLQRMGHAVSTAMTVKGASEQLRARQFDVLITDIGLPDGSGLDLLRLSGSTPPKRAVALSGLAMESDVAASRAAGFHAHMVKPLSFSDLRAALRG